MRFTEIKKFNNKNIKIRFLQSGDIEKAKKFQDFFNSLIEEDVRINRNKKHSLREGKAYLKNILEQVNKRQQVFLLAECENNIVGTTGISLRQGRQSHIGGLGITIRKNYRGIGLGSYLMKEIIKLAKKELKPKPEIIRLSVFPDNKPAINLYKKNGFKKVARIPKQFQYKGRLGDEIIMLLYL